MRRIRWLALLTTVVGGCTPTFDDQTSIVSGPRLLAVRLTPPEVTLGAAFTAEPLYVDAQGPRDPSGIEWTVCLRQKPLGEPDPVDPGCFGDGSAGVERIGEGGSATASMPANACQLFGPDSPPPQPGQPSARPTDPDTTGGFYLPLPVGTPDGAWSTALERIACPPSGLTQSVFVAFESGYQANVNPSLASLSVLAADGGAATSLTPDSASGAAPFVVSGGERVSLSASWPSCPTAAACGDGACSAGETPTSCPADCASGAAQAGCEGAEIYLAIDPVSRQIGTRRESIVASWYATGGAFDEPRDGRDEGDLATNVVNHWTAPTAPQTVHLWVVLRDARGGVGWASYTIAVR